jgi:flagellin
MAVHLSKAVRSNLLALQSTAAAMAKTQQRLATGLRVNSALDNPSSFFTATALKSRATDMSNLLDAMSSGIKTIEAADNGLKSITKTVESMQSTLRQARQDKSFKSVSFSFENTGSGDPTYNIDFSGGSLGDLTTAIMVDTAEVSTVVAGDTAYTNLDFSGGPGNGFGFYVERNGDYNNVVVTASSTPGSLSVVVDSLTVDFAVDDVSNVTLDEMQAALSSAFDQAGVDVTVGAEAGKLTFSEDYRTVGEQSLAITNLGSTGMSLGDLGFGAGGVSTQTSRYKSVDSIVADINGNSQLSSAMRASNDGGKLRIENLSTRDLNIGSTSNGVINGATDVTSIAGNKTRANLVKQFNDLRDQLDKFADDASFNGINLLRGDKLKLTFNETGTSTIDIQAKDASGAASSINNQSLGIDLALDSDLDSDADIDARLDVLKGALDRLRSQASAFGSNLSVVQNRTDFTHAMINTLRTGADNLTLADTNEEAANLLALQTRQQLSTTALSMAAQADQAVLRLFS